MRSYRYGNSLVITRVEQVVDVDGPPELPEGRAAAHGAEGAVFFVADVCHGEDGSQRTRD